MLKSFNILDYLQEISMTEDMNDIYHFLELDQQKTIFQMFCWRFNDLGLALTRLGS